ncbi:hypothetical protein [Nocardia sp. NPDC056000]|uniref:hypothetical protein n=1 Tax=Nocardia sp. NPDC056000 TaxID=3345674 RepID=UPI0035D9C7FC
MDHSQQDRDLALDFLRENVTPVDDPAVFRDDMLMLAVSRLDVHDPAWLLAQITDPNWPRELREQLAMLMPSHRREALALLARSD